MLVETCHSPVRLPRLSSWAGLVDGNFVDGDFVGWWILEPPERADKGPVKGQAELGYRILGPHWRKVLASGGAREFIRAGSRARADPNLRRR